MMGHGLQIRRAVKNGRHPGGLRAFYGLLVLAALAGWAPSAYAQPVPAETIRFSHEFHLSEDVGAECETCHKAAESTTVRDRLLPGMAICGEECHDVEDQEECILCHLDMNTLGKIEMPERELIFSHKDHLDDRDLTCLSCHTGVEKTEKTGGAHLPEMAVCSTCHEGEKAANECASCHTNWIHLRPDSHTQDWVHEHGRRVRTGDAACAACHSQPECQECHEGAHLSVNLPALGTQTSFAPQSRGDAGLVLKRNHGLNYRFTHALDAKGKERECATCHELDTFCADCHRPESDRGFFRPAWHGGPDWGAIAGAVGSGGGRHARLARRDMERCAACHGGQSDDPVCLLCHMDRTPGMNNDPNTHGSRFQSQVGRGDFHNNPNSLCFNCHTFKGPAGGPGFCGYCHGQK